MFGISFKKFDSALVSGHSRKRLRWDNLPQNIPQKKNVIVQDSLTKNLNRVAVSDTINCLTGNRNSYKQGNLLNHRFFYFDNKSFFRKRKKLSSIDGWKTFELLYEWGWVTFPFWRALHGLRFEQYQTSQIAWTVMGCRGVYEFCNNYNLFL